MKLLKKYVSRKYLLRILLTVSLSVVVLLIVSGWAIYVNSEKTVLKVQEEANAKVLTQINYNIDYMNVMVKNLAVSLFFAPESVYLLNSREMDKSDFYLKMMRMENVVNTSPFLDSIIIYNKQTNCYYSTRYSSSCKDDGMGGLVDRYLQENSGHVPKMEFIPLQKSAGDHIDMFSYVIYEDASEVSGSSMLILNVKSEWLIENINLINKIGMKKENVTFIMDRMGHTFEAGRPLPFNVSSMAPVILKHRDQIQAAFDTFIVSDGGRKWIVSYKDTGANNWLIVSAQDYNNVFAEINRLRSVSIGILFAFIVLSIIASIAVSLMLYRPLNRMLVQMGSFRITDEDLQFTAGDEFSFISDRYRLAYEGVNQLKKEQEEKQGGLKTYILRRLLMDSSAVTAQELRNAAENGTFQVDFESPMLLVLLQIEGRDRKNELYKSEEKRLYKFAAGNIAEELISRSFVNEVVDMRNDHLAVLLNVANFDNETERELVNILQEVQGVFTTYYRVSITISVSDPVHHMGELSKQYGKVLEQVQYRFVYGKQSIILPAMVKENMEDIVFQFPSAIAKKLEESIKAGDDKGFDAQMDSLDRYVHKLNYDNMIYMLLHLISILNHSIKEISKNSMLPVNVDLKAYYQRIMEKETWEEAQQTLKDMFNDISALRKDHSSDKTNSILADTIKDIIEDHYSDPNLSLQFIASTLKMSTTHISKIFRERELTPVNEYINDIRLHHARLLLETSELTVNEIMERVGFGNQSYFFKLFKKKYGTTPKEYRTKKIVM